MDNSEILAALRGQDFVSGQELCEKLNISRTAVWKRIRQLQEAGYVIEAVTNRGYRMVGCPDILAEDEIGSRLRTRWAGRPVRCFQTITSTNEYARKMGEEGAAQGLLVLADEQTAGKGRAGRRWATPPGANIAMTLLLRPQLPPDRIAMVTLVMGMAVTKACRMLYDLPAGIKWPNDVAVKGKKLSGTLTELSAELTRVNYIVIGTGINVNQLSFPEEIKDLATSLQLELGRECSRSELIAETMYWFEQYYEAFLQTRDMSGLKEEYESMLLNLNREVRVLDPAGAYTGTARGIDELGQLLVDRENGEQVRIYAGEVSVRGLYGYV